MKPAAGRATYSQYIDMRSSDLIERANPLVNLAGKPKSVSGGRGQKSGKAADYHRLCHAIRPQPLLIGLRSSNWLTTTSNSQRFSDTGDPPVTHLVVRVAKAKRSPSSCIAISRVRCPRLSPASTTQEIRVGLETLDNLSRVIRRLVISNNNFHA